MYLNQKSVTRARSRLRSGPPGVNGWSCRSGPSARPLWGADRSDRVDDDLPPAAPDEYGHQLGQRPHHGRGVPAVGAADGGHAHDRGTHNGQAEEEHEERDGVEHWGLPDSGAPGQWPGTRWVDVQVSSSEERIQSLLD